uniref:Uncharacterized protein LOC104215517 n=1 Tax=Nicotiana sylvestris TaxID=4096 RepID=A0A1U7VP17_NICSY|nr:PREDICTED: uncharacterized protein LOC104215517 [Nicotiana sylvestris]
MRAQTEDYIALRQEVVNILRQGHLKELLSDRGRTNFARGRKQHQGPPNPPSPALTIHMIIGGGDTASINNVKFTTTHKLKRSITHEWYDELEESIIFNKSYTDGLTFPYNDALVITLRILDTNIRRIMVDDESGTCIIHHRVFVQMKLKDKILPHCITLTGFNNAVKRTFGEITLIVLTGGVTLESTFHIMDQDTAYNAIPCRYASMRRGGKTISKWLHQGVEVSQVGHHRGHGEIEKWEMADVLEFHRFEQSMP